MNDGNSTLDDSEDDGDIRRGTTDSSRNSSQTWRAPLAAFLGVVAALSLVLAVAATWVTTTLLDTDEWVEAVAPLPEDPEIQQAVATKVADDVLALVDLPTLVEDAVGPAGKFLAAPVEDATRGFIENATIRVLASPAFESLWIEANRAAHEEAVRVLKGDAVVDELVNGQVAIDLVPLINNVIADVSQNTPGLFGGAVSVPAVSADQVDQAATTLASALGVTIPPEFGQVPVFDGDKLSSAQDVVQWLDDGTIALWVLFVLAFVGSIVASIDRRRTVVFVSVVTAVTAVIVWILRRPLETDIVNQIKNSNGKQATEIVIDVALWKNLGPFILALVIVSVLAALIAYLVGPSNSAVKIRQSVVGLFGDHHPQTSASQFMRRHTTAFRVLGAVAAVVAMLSIPDLTWGWFMTILVVLIAYEISWAYVVPVQDQPVDEPDATVAVG